jgi:hypothetical protein
MRIGVIFPQTEITEDPTAVRDYAQAAEALGYTHILAFDHVVGADTTNRPNWGIATPSILSFMNRWFFSDFWPA